MGEWRYSSAILDLGEWSASSPSHFTPEDVTLVPVVEEAGRAPELVWTL
jgi:hypothetical protein